MFSKSLKSESIFVEVSNPKESNVVIGCIYKHQVCTLMNLMNFL